MNIKDFVNNETHKLSDFLEYWTKRNLDDPAIFPMDLTRAEWIEQFEFFEG